MASSSVEDRVQAIAERVAIDHGLELVHAEVAGPDNKPIVRVFIDKPAGVTHQDCSDVSLHLGTILDVEDFIHSSYTLELSSPGLDVGFINARILNVSPVALPRSKPSARSAISEISGGGWLALPATTCSSTTRP